MAWTGTRHNADCSRAFKNYDATLSGIGFWFCASRWMGRLETPDRSAVDRRDPGAQLQRVALFCRLHLRRLVMAVYYCSRCDGDYTPCVEDPKGKNFEVMCCDHEDENRGEFTPEQEATIERLKSQSDGEGE